METSGADADASDAGLEALPTSSKPSGARFESMLTDVIAILESKKSIA
jgi:hypothetical protein